jgi:hypothetical protein
MTLDEYFASGPDHERPTVEAVLAHLETVGPVHVEPVSVGIFLKRAQTFAQLRPKDRWEALSFSLGRRVDHPRIRRKVVAYGSSYYHVADLRSPDDLDDDIRGWLTEAFHQSPT